MSYKAALETIEINLLGTFLMCREAAKVMMQNKFGRIINFGSMAVKHEVQGEAIYTASKAAIVSLTKILAKEVYPYGITCNVVAPSAIETELMKPIERQPGSKDYHVLHVKNFLDCMRSREKPLADVELAHETAVACHLANIGARLRRYVAWDAKEEKIPGDAEAQALVTYPYRAPWKLPKI